ncbi:MAG: 50S ribosomal protein L32 [Deltaproteobacteria bacterium RBG_13_49_15]|nr:MAG: 50S ribosomal protein L32 [Deltaproteobacteria bacterium RBG_13_49_15]
MALPKHKISKSRRDKRRTHQKTTPPNLTTCPQCGEAKLQHRACPNCGHYKGRAAVEIEES